MLNPFPDLLTYSFFAPTLLRVVVACFFFYVAYQQYSRRHTISSLQFSGFVPLAVAFHALVGLALFSGYYTQIAAVGALGGLIIGWFLNRQHPSVVILPNTAVVLLIVMSLSLLLTGAGALAFDVPL